MSDRTVALIRRTFDDRHGFDTGVSHALLERVSDGGLGATFRIAAAGRVVAFGRRDVHASGFRRAVALTRDHGYQPIVRMPGGRAAVFHDQVISFSWTVPDADPVSHVDSRFVEAAHVIAGAIERVGVTARVGEIPGEYCPGAYSVNHAGSIKVAGIGQRLARHAAHVGGVLVVGGASRIRDVLVPVYDALGLALSPETIGAVDDVIPGLGVDQVIEAVIDTLSGDATLVPNTFDHETLARASDLAHLHTL